MPQTTGRPAEQWDAELATLLALPSTERRQQLCPAPLYIVRHLNVQKERLPDRSGDLHSRQCQDSRAGLPLVC